MISRATTAFSSCVSVILFVNGLPSFALAQEQIPLVDIRSVDKTIVIDLRYAGSNNVAGRPLYPRKTRAMIRPEVAERLAVAQAFLHKWNHGLKIWDAYRPPEVQIELWQAAGRSDYVANPETINGSLHSWGLAVDATLVDSQKREKPMPTDFDDFTPAAMWRYQGSDPNIRANLAFLQTAMRKAGFYGLKREWWHFIAPNWRDYVPDKDINFGAHKKLPNSKP
jgi:D-alanyl-D-alanine dipeptidase